MHPQFAFVEIMGSMKVGVPIYYYYYYYYYGIIIIITIIIIAVSLKVGSMQACLAACWTAFLPDLPSVCLVGCLACCLSLTD